MPNAEGNALRAARLAGRGGAFASAEPFHNWHHWRRFAGFYGWAGPLFWPYAYDDIYDDVFWGGPPYADAFWNYGYGDIYGGLFSPFGAGELAGFVPGAGGVAPAASPLFGQIRQMCGEDTRSIADWPIARIRQLVGPDEQQRVLLEDLATASLKAAQTTRAACPSAAALTPTGRLAAMQVRLEAMIQAVDIVRPPLDKFYDSLNDEQKARLVAVEQSRQGAKTSVAQSCAAANPVPQWPQAAIEKVVHPTPDQQGKLDALKNAVAQAADLIAASCPAEIPATPPARLDAMAKRLDAMLQAVKTVRPPLDDFYASLNDEQKAQFDMIGAQPATARR
jgi:hypothetical protein